MNLKKAERILIIRFSSLGDILLTTPLLRVLKKKYPKLKIDYLIKSNFTDAIKFNPNLNQVFSWNGEKEFSEVINKLKQNNYDSVIDLQNNFKSRKVVRKIKVSSASYRKPNIKKFLLVKTKLNLLKEKRSIPQRYIDVVPNLELDGKGLELFLPNGIESKINSEKEIIGFAPGAFHFTKRWSLEYYEELGNQLTSEGFQIVIFGGKSDREICNKLQNKISNSINLSNDNLLFKTAMDMQKCKLIVCNDSGLMHTATAVGVPVVSIFGSTVREFGFAPFGVNNLVIENIGLSCRPCSHIGKANCKKKHFNCMMELTPQRVYKEIKDLMSEI
ncbi:MAG: lipopolysaccharide heptosyltransferase II [Melioribacteraceae bacterium]|nr:lipopolysaccharide heptosyltransferase II [Melioribacteraceae bacterium]